VKKTRQPGRRWRGIDVLDTYATALVVKRVRVWTGSEVVQNS
jgi:hypothetical protein